MKSKTRKRDIFVVREVTIGKTEYYVTSVGAYVRKLMKNSKRKAIRAKERKRKFQPSEVK